MQFNLDSLTFRLGVTAIVAGATGSLTGRLHKSSERLRAEVISHRQATEQVEGLRQVAPPIGSWPSRCSPEATSRR